MNPVKNKQSTLNDAVPQEAIRSHIHGVPPDVRKRKVLSLKVGAPVSGAGAFPNFSYHGGPVINTPRAYAIYLGDWSSAANQTRSTRLSQFVSDMLNSKYMNIMSQYGCGTSGSLISSVFVASSDHDLSATDIHTVLQTAINNNTIPEPTNRSNIYLLFLDDATAVNDAGAGAVMCEATSDTAFGYHDFFTTTAGNTCVFAVLPGLTDTCLKNSCGSDSGCSLHLSQTQEQRQTQVTSHEVAEMISDPQLNAWFDPDAGTGENGDLCNGQTGTITVGSNVWNVQLMYSKWHDLDTNGATTCLAEIPNPLPSYLFTSPRLPSRAQISCISRSTDKLDIFVSDNNGAISTAAWEPAFTDWWHGWWGLNNGRAAAGAPVYGVSRSTDKLDVFVVGTDSRVYTAAWEPDFTDWWHGWWPLNNGVAAPGAHVTAVSRSTDKLDVFVVGTDGRVYTAAWEPDFTDWWHGWWPIGNIILPQGAPVHAVSRSADKLDIFATDVNGVIWTAAWEPDFTDGWHGWWQLNGGRAAPGAHVTAVSRNTDKLDVFVVGTDGRVYTAAWEPDFTDWWHGWWPIGNIQVPQGAPVNAVSRSADKLDIFATDVNGVVSTAAWEPAFTDWWHGWWDLNGGRAASGAPVTAVSRSTDKLDAFVVGTDGRVYTAAWEPSFPDWWHGWWPIGN